MSGAIDTQFPGALPTLVFGDSHTPIEQGFHGMVDKFSHLTPGCDYDTKLPRGFFYRGNRFVVGGLAINQTYYGQMTAVSAVQQHNILIPLAGVHHGVWHGKAIKAYKNQGFFIPANDRFEFATELDQVAGSLIVSYDIQRLNQVLQAMTGSEKFAVGDHAVRPLPLAYGGVNFKTLFLSLFAQIDAFAGREPLLRLNGFEDQFYRILGMAVRPECFLPHAGEAPIDASAITGKRNIMHEFERYVEQNLERVILLSELERVLGVTTRTLQYACMRRHGCSPRVYIRQKKLELAYERLRQARQPLKIADLAFELGFSSQSQFSRFFRERFGVLPSQL